MQLLLCLGISSLSDIMSIFTNGVNEVAPTNLGNLCTKMKFDPFDRFSQIHRQELIKSWKTVLLVTFISSQFFLLTIEHVSTYLPLLFSTFLFGSSLSTGINELMGEENIPCVTSFLITNPSISTVHAAQMSMCTGQPQTLRPTVWDVSGSFVHYILVWAWPHTSLCFSVDNESSK